MNDLESGEKELIHLSLSHFKNEQILQTKAIRTLQS